LSIHAYFGLCENPPSWHQDSYANHEVLHREAVLGSACKGLTQATLSGAWQTADKTKNQANEGYVRQSNKVHF
jgi:hypothetical protein